MKTMTSLKVRRANTRGMADHGWLKTSHSFSFARYYAPDHINFGALRVWNDDVILPGKGFDLHPHDNMEIITIPLKGSVLHRDTMGNEQIISAGEVQVMSAGEGLFHAEYNASNTEDLSLFQIWIFPDKRNVVPVYHQQKFESEGAYNKWQKLVAPIGDKEALTINQKAWIHRSNIVKGNALNYTMNPSSFGCYLMVVDGEVEIDGVILKQRDAIEISGANAFELKAITNCSVVNVEVPDYN